MPEFEDPKTAVRRIYGLDNCAAKGDSGRLDPSSKRFRGGTITWQDRPGIGDLTAEMEQKGRYRGDFISFVRGGSEAETCWCQFTVVVAYQPPAAAGQQGRTTGKLQKVRGNRCKISGVK